MHFFLLLLFQLHCVYFRQKFLPLNFLPSAYLYNMLHNQVKNPFNDLKAHCPLSICKKLHPKFLKKSFDSLLDLTTRTKVNTEGQQFFF